MRNKSCGNGSKNCVAFRNEMRNGIAIGNPSLTFRDWPLSVKTSDTKIQIQYTSDSNFLSSNIYREG